MHHQIIALCLGAALCLCCHLACAADLPVAHVARGGYQELTSYEALQEFFAALQRTGRCDLQAIAQSRQGRTITAVRFSPREHAGGPVPRLRVLLFAQQHGDEPSGKEALTLLLAALARADTDVAFGNLELTIIPQMNPDGAEAGQRLTSEGIDLNRSHLILNAPETRGLHAFIHSWLPDVSVDIHEYGSFSKSWSDSGIIKTGDVQLGMLTNLNISPALRRYQREAVFPAIRAAVEGNGYSFHEYIVGSPSGRIRHSTTEINDGRQSLGALHTLAFIQEGRQWRTATEQLERRTHSQLAALIGLLRFCDAHAREIRDLVAREREDLRDISGRMFVTLMEHTPSDRPMRIPVENVQTGEQEQWEVRPYHGIVTPVAEIKLPSAYLVPDSLTDVLEILSLQGVRLDTLRESAEVSAEVTILDSATTLTIEDETHVRWATRSVTGTARLEPGDLLVRLDQLPSILVATLLEPGSMWGVSWYKRFEGFVRTGPFPVLRLTGSH